MTLFQIDVSKRGSYGAGVPFKYQHFIIQNKVIKFPEYPFNDVYRKNCLFPQFSVVVCRIDFSMKNNLTKL